MNEIVNTHEDFLNTPLKNFTASEIDILMAIMYKCQDKEGEKITLDLGEVKKLADYKNKNMADFIESVKRTNQKLMSLNFEIRRENVITQFVLFPEFEINFAENTLKIKVAEKFIYLLNKVDYYTPIELKESSSLKSSYSKQIYKKLRRFRENGWWYCPIDEFREYLDIPKSYKIGHIYTKILIPSIKELEPFFKGLSFTPVEGRVRKAGRPPVIALRFTFQKQVQGKDCFTGMDKACEILP